jgi:hypothetical protein
MLQTMRLNGVPRILHVTKQSRSLALERYRLSFGDILPNPVYIDFAHDNLVICDYAAFRLFANIDLYDIKLERFMEMLQDLPPREQDQVKLLTLAINPFHVKLPNILGQVALFRGLRSIRLQVTHDAPMEELSSAAACFVAMVWLPYQLTQSEQYDVSGAFNSAPMLMLLWHDTFTSLRGLGFDTTG